MKYVKQLTEKGYDRDRIVKALLSVGWDQTIIDEVFVNLGYPSPPAPITDASNSINTNTVQAQTSSAADIPNKPTTAPTASQTNQLTGVEPSTNPVVASANQPARKKKWWVLIAASFVLLIILTAATYYLLVYNNNDQRTLIKSLTASINASSVDYRIRGSIKFTSKFGQSNFSGDDTLEPTTRLENQPTILNYQLTAKQQRNTENDPQIGEYSLELMTTKDVNNLTPTSFDLALDIKSASDQQTYIKLSQPTYISGISLAPLLERWFKISPAELQSLTSLDLLKPNNSKQDLDYWQKFIKVYSEHPFVKITNSSNKNEITRRLKEYNFVIDELVIAEFIAALDEEINGSSGNLNTKELLNLNFFSNSTVGGSGSIAIDPKTKLIYSLSIEVIIDNPLLKVSITNELNVNDYNQPVVVVTPSLSETFTMLQEDLQEILMDTPFSLFPPNSNEPNFNDFDNF